MVEIFKGCAEVQMISRRPDPGEWFAIGPAYGRGVENVERADREGEFGVGSTLPRPLEAGVR